MSALNSGGELRMVAASKLELLKPPDQLLAVMTVLDKDGANQDDLGFVMDLQRPSATNSSRLEVAEQLVQDQQSGSPVRVAQTMERLAMHTRSLNKQAYFSLLDKPLLGDQISNWFSVCVSFALFKVPIANPYITGTASICQLPEYGMRFWRERQIDFKKYFPSPMTHPKTDRWCPGACRSSDVDQGDALLR